MLENLNKKLFDDFCEFTTPYIYSKDIDPVYPVLKDHYDSLNLDEEHRIWRTFLYVTHYSLKSAEILWEMFPDPTQITTIPKLTTGIERRGFRGAPSKVIEHINHFYYNTVRCMNTLEDWMSNAVGGGGLEGWDNVRRFFKEIKHNGNWASYKWADLMKNVHEYPIEATDIGVGGGGETAGPIPGMVLITGENWQRCAEDRLLQRALMQLAIDSGVPFNGLDQLETALCDFNSLYKGTYYNGNDLDLMMDQLDPYSKLWSSRSNVIPEEYLGEVQDWFGLRKELRVLYRDKGITNWL